MGSKQSYGAVFTHNVEKIKGAAHKNSDVEGTCKLAFTRTVNLTIFVSGSFNLLDVICKQHHRTALNPFLNDIENGDVDGTCKRSHRVNVLTIVFAVVVLCKKSDRNGIQNYLFWYFKCKKV